MKLKVTWTSTLTRQPSVLAVVLQLPVLPFGNLPGHEGVTVMLPELTAAGAMSFTKVVISDEVASQLELVVEAQDVPLQ
jgi:hypothetical protein